MHNVGEAIVVLLLIVQCTAQSSSPVKVLSILPGKPAFSDSASLQNRDSITIVFDSAVIALGSDWGSSIPAQFVPFELDGVNVPGKFRWVTTSIARFDPDMDWPSDLAFSVKVLPTKNFAGRPIENSISSNFTTLQTSMQIQEVTSVSAQLLTGDQWSTRTPKVEGGNTVYGWEVPPDGEIQINFATPIDITIVGPALKIVNSDDSTNVPLTYKACQWNTPTCITVVPSPNEIKADTMYSLTLPSNSKTSQYSGATTQDLTLSFSGLYPFQIPFIPSTPDSQIGTQKLSLYLRHGIEENSKEGFADAIYIDDATITNVSFVAKHLVVVTARLGPLESYTIGVRANPSVKDGYGLPLTASSVTMQSRASEKALVQAYAGNLRFLSFNQSWTVFSRDATDACGGYYVDSVNINPNNLVNALASIDNYLSIFVQSATRHPLPPSTPLGTIDVSVFPTGNLFSKSGLWMNIQRSCYGTVQNFQKMLVSKNNLGVTVISGPDGISVWVTRMDNNDVVPDALVTFYAYPQDAQWKEGGVQPRDIQAVATVKTDSLGIGKIKPDSTPRRGWIVVQVGDVLHVSKSLYYSGSSSTSITIPKISFVTDRSFHKPGDKIYIKGYVRNANSLDDTISLPRIVPWKFSIQWQKSTDDSEESVYVAEMTSFGTLELTVEIPADANFGSNSFRAYPTYEPVDVSADVPILIASPRIPTTFLNLTSTSRVFKPSATSSKTIDRTTRFNVTLSTYTGQAIPNATVVLRWAVTRERPSFWLEGYNYGWRALTESVTLIPKEEKGEITLTTDDNGAIALYNIVPSMESLLDKPLEEGNTVTVTASYFSPTKELLEQQMALPVAYSELSLSIKPTVDGVILPGFEFGAFVVSQDLSSADADQTSNVQVTLTLYEWDGVTPSVDRTTGEIGTDLQQHTNSTKSCTFLSVDGGNNIGCTFSMPKVSKFLLIAKAQDETGYIVSAVMPVGRNSSEWRLYPLNLFNSISMMLDKESYTIPSTASVAFFNPFLQARVLVRWGNAPNVKYAVSVEKQGTTRISIPIGKECFGGCRLDLVLTAPMNSFSLSVAVPLSKLYNPSSPYSLTKTFDIAIDQVTKDLKVGVTLQKEIEAPAASTGFTVSVQQDGKPVAAEVAIFVVDKAVLDLVPHPVVDYASLLADRTLAEYYSISDDRDELALESGYTESVKTLRRRMSANPWVSPPWHVFPLRKDSCIDDIDISDEEFFSAYVQTITYGVNGFFGTRQTCQAFVAEAFDMASSFGGGGSSVRESVGIAAISDSPRLFSKAKALPQAMDDSSHTISSSSTPVVPATVRTNFVTTPLFIGTLAVNSTGTATVSWKLPDNIGTFEVRAYAISKDSSFGSTTKDQIVRRQFSLQSSAPRIVRYNDKFNTGVSITIHEHNFKGDVVVEVNYVCQLLALMASPVKTVRLVGPGPHLVQFPFLAVGTGEAEIEYKVTYNTILQDAAIYKQSVFGQQDAVFVATSFSISESEEDSEGVVLPPAVNYSGALTINAGVGKLPAIKYLIDQCRQRISYNYVTADNYLATVMGHLALYPYRLSEQSMFETALSKLQHYTVQPYGLLLVDPSLLYYNSQYYWTYPELQAFGLLVLHETLKYPSLPSTQKDIVQSLMPQWESALTNSLVDLASKQRQVGSKFTQFDLLAFTFLGAGITWVPGGGDADIQADLALDRLTQHTDDLSSAGKAALALALLRGNAKTSVATILLEELFSTVRVQGRTAYVTEPHSQNPNFVATALSIPGYILTENENPLVEKIVNFAAMAEKPISKGYNYFSAFQVAYLMMALSSYDNYTGNAQPNITVNVHTTKITASTPKNGTLMNTQFTSPSDPPANVGFFFEDIGPNNEIQFNASGKGEASLVFGLTFIPAEILTEPVYRGIQVQKVIQRIDPATNDPIGPAIVSANVGEKVLVTIQITIPDYSSSIIIEDLFPGALEPLDDNIYGASTSTISSDVVGKVGRGGRGGIMRPVMYEDYWSWYLYRAFSVKEFRQDRVKFYGQQLFAGTHSVSYVALVNTEGEFVLPPAHAYDSLQPELMGLSAGGSFTTLSMSGKLPVVTDTMDSCLPWDSRAVDRSNLPSPRPGTITPVQSLPSTGPMQYWWAILLVVVGGILIAIAIIFAVKAKRAGNFKQLPKSKTGGEDYQDHVVRLNPKPENSDSDDL